MRSARNVIVLAFKEPRAEFDWDRLNTTAVHLKRRLGLNFPQYIRRITLDWSFRRATIHMRSECL